MRVESDIVNRTRAPGVLAHPLLLWSLISVVALFPGNVCPADEGMTAGNTDRAYSIVFDDGRLSVSVTQISIVDLMQLIGKEAGFAVVAYGDFSNRKVSRSFSDMPLADAVGRLLRDTSSIVAYRGNGEAGEKPAISAIYLLGSGPAGHSAVSIEMVEPRLDNQLRIDQIEASDSQDRLTAIDRTEGLTDQITLDNLVFSLQHDTDPEVRMRAVSALEGIGGASAVTALEAGIGDDDLSVRKKVVQALGKIEDERIPLWLGQVLMGDAEPEVRLEALRSLARMEGETAKVFLEAATGDPSSLVSEAALQFLR